MNPQRPTRSVSTLSVTVRLACFNVVSVLCAFLALTCLAFSNPRRMSYVQRLRPDAASSFPFFLSFFFPTLFVYVLGPSLSHLRPISIQPSRTHFLSFLSQAAKLVPELVDVVLEEALGVVPRPVDLRAALVLGGVDELLAALELVHFLVDFAHGTVEGWGLEELWGEGRGCEQVGGRERARELVE